MKKSNFTNNQHSFLRSSQEYVGTKRKTLSPEKNLTDYQLYQTEHDIVHAPYFMEKLVFEAIASGNLDSPALAGYTDEYSHGTISDSSVKEMEYMAVISVSSFTRAAIAGGVDSTSAYDLSDLFLQQIAKHDSIEDYTIIIRKALQVFTDKVKQTKTEKAQSIHVENAKNYIARHLNQKFSITDIADAVGVDKAHLMRLFKKNEGCTLTEYVNGEKVKAAKNMLTYSDYSVKVISFYLHFPSQSYFGEIFKKYTGMTPGTFRKQCGMASLL